MFRLLPSLYLGSTAKADDSQTRGASGCLQYAHLGGAEAREMLNELLKRTDALGDGEVPAQDLALLLWSAVLLGERAAATVLAQKLRGVAAVSHFWGVVNAARLRGGAAALLGEREAACQAYAEGLDWATRIRHRPEVALTRFELAELLLDDALAAGVTPEQRETELAEAQAHLDFAVDEFRAMKMQPSLERALRHKGLLHA
jgi:hypothetical protein